MILLSKESVEEFRNIYEAEYGERLSFETARQYAIELLDFCLFVMKASREINTEQLDKNTDDTPCAVNTDKQF